MERIDYKKVLPQLYSAYARLSQVTAEGPLPRRLQELVRIRASQINGCAYCLDMHSRDARSLGEDERRLAVMAAWREAPFFTPRERAAFAWTEAITLLPEAGAPDAIYEELTKHFSPEEIVALTWLIVVINGWNRLAVALRPPITGAVPADEPTAAGTAPSAG